MSQKTHPTDRQGVEQTAEHAVRKLSIPYADKVRQ